MSKMEKEDIHQLRYYILQSGTQSKWLRTVSDVEILRFLRARKGDIENTWLMLW